MAVDEALLASAATDGHAVLRFYTWEAPTLSLGYFQAAADRELHSASARCPLVRRSTGGGAILHDRELTYSLTVPNASGAAAARRLYEIVHKSLVELLATLGVKAALQNEMAACQSAVKIEPEPFLCFERRSCFDVIVTGAKIAGSAQRRRGKAVLQHGSILLAASANAPELPGMCDLNGAQISAAELATAWAPPLAAALGFSTREADLTDVQRAMAADFARERYGSQEFTYRR
jgi:lipoate-protein ligase A